MINILLCAFIILCSSIKSFAQIKSEPENEKYSQELKEKAEAGDGEAQYKLGRCYYFGCGIAKNQEEAFQWYMKSAQKGNSFGQAAVGASYAGGLGTEKNLLLY